MGQYPKDFNPSNRGRCKLCGYETRAHDRRWLERCPSCWQGLLTGRYARAAVTDVVMLASVTTEPSTR